MALVLMLIGILSALATGLALLVRSDTMQHTAAETTQRNFYLAEAGVNRAFDDFRNIFVSFNLPTAADYTLRSFTLGGRTSNYRLSFVSGPSSQTLPPGDALAGLNSIQYRYAVTADALGQSGAREARLGAEFIVNNVPLFQFLAFYTNDLEINPGVAMTLHGRVHTNGSLYLGPGANLSILDLPPGISISKVSAKNSLYRGRKDTTVCDTSPVLQIDKMDGTSQRLDCIGSTTQAIPQSQSNTWGGSLLSNVTSISPPLPAIITRGAGNLFWDHADLRIVLNLSNPPTTTLGAGGPQLYSIEVQNGDGSVNAAKTATLRGFMLNNAGKIFYNDVPACSLALLSTICASLRTNYTPAFAAANLVYRRADDASLDANWRTATGKLDFRRGGFFNNREDAGANVGKWMYLLNVDVQALLSWDRANANSLFDANDTSDGGVVMFLSVQGPASAGVNNYGVRVFDSANLGFDTSIADPTGITIASDQAVYVEGDYNSANKAPAAIVGDSLNVLSNSWEPNGADVEGAASLVGGTRTVGSAMTINAAFLAGVDQTSAGDYNGGLENYPRFHESWTGRTLTYRGSFVSLGAPAHANGPWCGTGGSSLLGCNIYDAPLRNWDYDPAFNDVAWLPPLSPRIVFLQQTQFGQEFD